MAKKQTVSSPESKHAGTAARKQPAKREKGPAERTTPARSASQPDKRLLAQEEIGNVAGEVWHVLSEQGGQSLAALKKAVDAPPDMIMASIGWLAREGKLDFSASNRSLTISLR